MKRYVDGFVLPIPKIGCRTTGRSVRLPRNTARYIDAPDLSNVNGDRDPNSIVLTLKLPILDG